MKITLDSPLSVSEIIAATDGMSLLKNYTVRKIVTDSREADFESLFVALDGKNTSGNNFISSAKEKGAITLGTSLISDIIVSDTEEALLALARYYKRKHLSKLQSTVAITGSVGKTTTKEFLYKLLMGRHKTHANYGNYNNTIGVPLTVLSAPKDTEILICELGMNSFGEIKKLSLLLEPDTAVITNIGTAHIGNLESRENIAKAKLEIQAGMSELALLYVPYSEKLLMGEGRKSFSTSTKSADISVLGEKNLDIFLRGKNLGTAIFKLKEHHHRECLAAAISIAITVSDAKEVIAAIPKISSNDTRAKIYKAKNFYLLDDAYNASYESINAALVQLFSLTEYTGKSILLGDVMELGDFSAQIHIEIGKLLSKFSLGRIYLYGKYAEHTASGAESMGVPSANILVFDVGKEAELTKKIKEQTKDGEILLVKGSHGMHLEKIIEELKR